MVRIIDYEAGNIRSVENAFLKLGEEAVITSDPARILEADHIVLPGVGNFGDAMMNLRRFGMEEVIREAVRRGIPLLGICVGMQAFFEGSEESPGVPGLGIVKGMCRHFPEGEGFKIPQIGWNSISLSGSGRLFEGIRDGAYMYFVHSFYCLAEERGIVRAETEFSCRFDASFEMGNLFATQFHPEKSGDTGLMILNNFLKISKS